MKKYNVYAIQREKFGCEDDPKIKLNDTPIYEDELEKAIRFYLMRGEWLDRGYYLKEEEIK